MKKILFALTLCLYGVCTMAQTLTQDIAEIIRGKNASIGVAVVYDGKEVTLSNDGTVRYPLMSVFKIHVALAALHHLQENRICLDSTFHIRPEQMHTDTYSPLRDKYPGQGIDISYRDLVNYTVSHSDNNTCDVLIALAGGIGRVEAYVRQLGIGDFHLSETELSMNTDRMNCYKNWGTPLSVAKLMQKVFTGTLLTGDYFRCLKEALSGCSTGADKLKAGFPAGVRFGHKTGSSGRDASGVKIGDNDAGLIYLPDGSHCYVVVLIKDSKETDVQNARIMEEVARAVYTYSSISSMGTGAKK